ncbi:hypothetical protein [Microvirga roseola]|uniref:hypothetical protein n=1 Tax=Microvirga roseola TaxID=2883126 RepID=UPI001E600ED4|nr:hypothetical protein [Microvirga roseola]
MTAAISCLATSAFIDSLADVGYVAGEGASVAEDAVKLLGVTFWSIYAVACAWRAAAASAISAPALLVEESTLAGSPAMPGNGRTSWDRTPKRSMNR